MMLRQGMFMMASTLVRFLTSGVLFILLARIWQVEEFGVFMYAFTLTGLLVLAIDYGFPLQIVRNVGREPKRVRTLVDEAIVTKILLTLSATMVLAALSFLVPIVGRHAPIIWILFLAAVLNSFGTFLQLPLRGLGAFDREAHIVAIYNPLHFAAILAVALAGFGPLPIAAVFAVSRLLYVGLAIRGYRKHVGPLSPASVRRGRLLTSLRTGLPFGIHTALGTLYMQVDTLILGSLLGVREVGLYQAGARLFLAGMIFADVIANTYLVRMSSQTADPGSLAALGTRMTRHLLVVGFLGLAVMGGGADLIVGLLYGSGYELTADLLLWFGVALFIRFGIYGFATVLTVVERQTVRAVIGACALAANVALNFLLIPSFGPLGAVVAAIATNVVIGVAYAAFTRHEIATLFVSHRSSLLVLVATLLSVWLGITDSTGPLQLGAIVLLMLLALPIGLTRHEIRGLWHYVATRLSGRTPRNPQNGPRGK